ncbi:MAG: 16S rRNA (guanine(966)-N(2))-methyltransferase RsmD [Deltaproteobacteria bacterium]|nr:16S rRNA (guanine(966)-N(2))-methyltransferase RsmD [Deltaproteobacteria bacterium]MBW2068023.1 16S rRNA (guanine(966)-N(2))-methyltransferase RsmD [Deltaproteobacteria bacterium]
MITVTGGKFKGRRLRIPQGRGVNVRPTTNRVRQALFDSLGHEIYKSSVLDLFAGSGALGIEAISRGATRVVFVENDRRACAIIKANVRDLGIQKSCEVLCSHYIPALKRLARQRRLFDIVLSDPPYEANVEESILELALPVLKKNGLLILEKTTRKCFEINSLKWQMFKIRNFGDTALYFLKLANSL